ncbi:MAG: glycosyltransferase [Bacteroidales bacterium]|nr:glycosyltransferase [Bacteroidales bacterium]
MKFGFVILHYLCPEMTRQAVSCLLGLSRKSLFDTRIVVVDNCSPDGSGRQLQMDYEGNNDVTVLLLNENYGFARGNNAGYEVLCRDCDFIVVMNNDVLVEQKDFMDKVSALYSKHHFAVMGPDIFAVKSNVHQSPSRSSVMTRQEVTALYKNLIYRNKCFTWRYLTYRLKCMLGISHPKIPVDSAGWDIEQENAVLHGACYIFSKDFVSKRDYAFNPLTFLYLEEDILAKECELAGLKMVYCPALRVKHLEDVSTDKAYKWNLAKEKMKARRMLDSCRILMGLYE